MFGTAIAVLVSLRACVCVGVAFGEEKDACAGVAGVETCVNSLSEGACEVAGVSGSDGAAIVDVSEGGSSTAVCSCPSSAVPSLAGNATAAMVLCRFCLFRRRGMARDGKAVWPSAMEYQGSCG